MKKEFIRSKECRSCGANIAAHLQNCPYCNEIQPTEDLLPEDTYKKVEAKLLSIEKNFDEFIWNSRDDHSYYFALFRITLIPLLLSAATFFIFNSWILALILLASSGIIAYIRKDPAYHFYYLSYKFEKDLWKKKYKAELDALMKEYNAPPSAYQDIVLDIMETKEYGEFSRLLVLMDPVDE